MVVGEVADPGTVRGKHHVRLVSVHDELKEENNGRRDGFGTQAGVGVDMPPLRRTP